jgi:hypothetical protein
VHGHNVLYNIHHHQSSTQYTCVLSKCR